MREIKFRGKVYYPADDKGETFEWVYGGYDQTSGKMFYRKEDGRQESPYVKCVGQYTGLTDKNGKEIYEGDIVEAFDGEEILKVDWIKALSNYGFRCYGKLKKTKQKTLSYLGYAEFVDYSENGECANLKVVGNIYDNPELLRGEK